MYRTHNCNELRIENAGQHKQQHTNDNQDSTPVFTPFFHFCVPSLLKLRVLHKKYLR